MIAAEMNETTGNFEGFRPQISLILLSILQRISLAVITALVGADDLGQQICIGLDHGIPGGACICPAGATITERPPQRNSRNMLAQIGAPALGLA